MADRVIEIKNGKVGAMRQNEHPMDVAEIEWQKITTGYKDRFQFT